MILKGNQRANGGDLAIHLMNGFDNERVEIAEVYGTVAGDLAGAFAEFEAVAAGTKAEQYLYSLSINPSSPLTREQYHEAVQDIEDRLGLSGQPRAVVFHIKDGREHCHVVWSRIDLETMKAIPMSHDRRRLMDMACELAEKFDLDLPPGLKAWQEKEYGARESLDPTLAEKHQQEATGISPEQRRDDITACYEQADSGEAFRAALEEKGYMLAKGDRRGFVVVDGFGNPHSLTRYVKGHKAKEIKARLAPLTPDDLPSVDEAKEIIRARRQAQKESQGEGEQQGQDSEQGEWIAHAQKLAREALEKSQAARRETLQSKEQELFTRQQDERLQLHAAQAREAKGVVFKVRSAVADLMRQTPGLRSVLAPVQKLTGLDPKERHALERDALTRRHAREKLDIEREKRTLSRLERREQRAQEHKWQRELRKAKEMQAKVRQEFDKAAHDHIVRDKTDSDDGELSTNFNDTAEFVEGADRVDEGDDDDERKPNWKHRTEGVGRGRKPRGGKGYGYRRDSE